MVDWRAARAAIISMLKAFAILIGILAGMMAAMLAGVFILVRFEAAGAIAVIAVGLVAMFISEYRFEKRHPRW